MHLLRAWNHGPFQSKELARTHMKTRSWAPDHAPDLHISLCFLRGVVAAIMVSPMTPGCKTVRSVLKLQDLVYEQRDPVSLRHRINYYRQLPAREVSEEIVSAKA